MCRPQPPELLDDWVDQQRFDAARVLR
jgi:hypothetical protein